jgi:hypothetical protein
MADPTGLVIDEWTHLTQQLSRLTAKDVGELQKPSDIWHHDPSLNARNRFVPHPQVFCNRLLG